MKTNEALKEIINNGMYAPDAPRVIIRACERTEETELLRELAQHYKKQGHDVALLDCQMFGGRNKESLLCLAKALGAIDDKKENIDNLFVVLSRLFGGDKYSSKSKKQCIILLDEYRMAGGLFLNQLRSFAINPNLGIIAFDYVSHNLEAIDYYESLLESALNHMVVLNKS